MEEKNINQPEENGVTSEEIGKEIKDFATEEAKGCLGGILNQIKWFLIIVGVIAIALVGYLALSENGGELFSDDASYIDMVKSCYVEALGTTYGDVFDGAENSKWSYFETEDGRQIVELNAENNGEEACIQFQLTKQSGNNYWIEPVYTDINGVSVDPTFFFAALMS